MQGNGNHESTNAAPRYNGAILRLTFASLPTRIVVGWAIRTAVDVCRNLHYPSEGEVDVVVNDGGGDGDRCYGGGSRWIAIEKAVGGGDGVDDEKGNMGIDELLC